MSGFTRRQLMNLVHEELFSTFPLGRSLLLIPHLQVALDFPVIPLSNHRLQMPVLPLGPTSLFDSAAFVVESSSPSETFPVTVARATQTSSAVATLWRRPPRLPAPPTRSTVCRGHTHPLVRLPSVSSEVQGLLVVVVSRSACTSSIFIVSCGFVSCPDNGMLSALHTSLNSVLFF